MAAIRAPEHRIIRIDYELMQIELSPGPKGEAVERILKVELEPHVNASFTKGKILTAAGSLTAECDLILHHGEPEQHDNTTVVPHKNVICVIESKTDLSKSALENGINDWIQDLKETADIPVFLIGVRHANTRQELRDISAADETAAFGTLREQGDAEAMAHSGEVESMVKALHRAEEEHKLTM